MHSHFKTLLLGLMTLLISTEVIAAGNSRFKLRDKIETMVDNYCIDCHERGNSKGGVRLDNLTEVPLKSRLETLNKVKEQLFSYNMPPKKKSQPKENERLTLLQWADKELSAHKASTLDNKLDLYRYGNLVPHDKLFSGEIKETPYTTSRYWRINEFIYNERVKEVLGKSDRSRKTQRHMASRAAMGRDLDGKNIIGLPIIFSLPNESGVTYYDTDMISSSNFLALKKNAEWIVDVQSRSTLLEIGAFKYPELFLKTRQRYRFQRYPQFKYKASTPAPFTKVFKSKRPSDADISAAIKYQFKVALQRSPSSVELKKYLDFVKEGAKQAGYIEALKKVLVAILMEPEFFYRSEIGKDGKLTPREAAYAIAYALTDYTPDQKLFDAANSGKLKTKADYEREVRRILADNKIAKPRILRFFRDYFGYIKVRKIFKEDQRFEGKYNPAKPVSYYFDWHGRGFIIDEADMFVERILKKDKQVLKNLLTSDEFLGHYNFDPKSQKKTMEKQRQVYKFLKSKMDGKKKLSKSQSKKLAKELKAKFKDDKYGRRTYSPTSDYKKYKKMFGADGNKTPSFKMPGPEMLERFFENSFDPKKPKVVQNRKGILTHPAWLIAHSHNCYTDPVIRGKWIQEKLLGGYIPQVPIEVEAQLINDHNLTIRERLVKTEAQACWGCHKKMNTLGNPFENYDDFGRFRTRENLEHEDNVIGTVSVIRKIRFGEGSFNKKIYKTKPLNTSGYLEGTGDKRLDGKVKDSHDLIDRLAKSDRVRQVFIRNVFRYFMGRNEMLSDSKTLIEADRAYVKSGGSFKELLVSILTSDSFINRKASQSSNIRYF